MRVASEKAVNSGGWIHKLNVEVSVVEYLKQTRPDPKRLSVDEVEKLVHEMYEHPKASDLRKTLAIKLGVFDWSLELLNVGYGKDHRGEFASFPCRDERGRFIGISRRYGDGSKMTYRGTSNSGLFYEDKWAQHIGAVLIVEGGSDVAACVSEGISAIGRPSNIGGASRIAAMVRTAKKRVIVVGERDEKPEYRGVRQGCEKTCRGCAQCWPGLYGAKKVAIDLAELGISASVKIPKSAKDARALHNILELREWARG